MALKGSVIKRLLANYDANRNKEEVTEVETVVAAALKRAGYDKVVVFMHDGEFVMINTIASPEAKESGLILNEDQTQIIGFKNSNDRKSVTTEALARCLILESVDDEADKLRLLTLFKYQYNWIIHYVPNETLPENSKGGESRFPKFICNAHTHGLNAYTHKDFQIVLEIGRDSCTYLLNALAERVRDGETFAPGEKIKDLYPECEIKLAAVKDGGRDVLRVLIPDENNIFPDEGGCSYPYSEQARILE